VAQHGSGFAVSTVLPDGVPAALAPELAAMFAEVLFEVGQLHDRVA